MSKYKNIGENMGKISVIIPVYNKEDYIRMTIQSVLNQTFSDFEIVIIDDGSTDKSKDIINEFSENQKITYHYQKNQGVAAARNAGIKKANGDYIAFLDADDRWDDSFLEKLNNEIDSGESCYCGYYNIKPNGEIKKQKISFSQGDITKDFLNNKTKPHLCCWLFKKQFLVINQIQFEESLDFGEDLLFLLDVTMVDKNVQHVDEHLFYYTNDVPGSLDTKGFDKINKDIVWLKMLKDHIDRFTKSSNQKAELTKIVDEYRIPGSIVYKLLALYSPATREKVERTFEQYHHFTDNVSLINNFRSIKLKMALIQLRFKIYGLEMFKSKKNNYSK